MSSVQVITEEKDYVGAVWRYLPKIARNFRFSEQEMRSLMGDMPRATYTKGLKTESVRLNKDQFSRVSLLLGIEKALKILFSGNETKAFSWIDRPNSLPPFFGTMPRAFLTQGDFQQLYEPRKMLDAWRG
jgi:hypothetical protein